MKYESPVLEITNFDIRTQDGSQNQGCGAYTCTQTPDMDL